MIGHRSFLAAGVSVLAIAVAWGEEKATARDMFFAGLKTATTKQKAPPVRPDSQQRPPRQSAATRPVDVPPPQVRPQAPAQAPAPESRVEVRQAVYTSAPLGIRYTVIDEKKREIPADTTFRSGDRIRLSVEVNDSGYLYIVHQGSSGTWKLMFPSAETGHSNSVAPGRKYLLPPEAVLTFVGKPGVEKLFLVLSRKPELALDELVYAIGGKGTPGAAEPPRERPQQPMLIASGKPIDNAVVRRLRTSYSRDLIIQKVQDEEPGKQENAVYVVNPTGDENSRVVADIELVHQ
jgi:hypothetical protein